MMWFARHYDMETGGTTGYRIEGLEEGMELDMMSRPESGRG